MKIITNNQPRRIIEDSELTATERAEFDYLDWAAVDEGNDSASFFRYKGQLYDLGDAMTLSITLAVGPFKGWHGHYVESYLTGVLVKYADEYCEKVIVGRYHG